MKFHVHFSRTASGDICEVHELQNGAPDGATLAHGSGSTKEEARDASGGSVLSWLHDI